MPDPYSESGARVTNTVSLRDDPLGRMIVRRQISETQATAGRTLQRYFESLEVGAVQAMDPTKEPVDGRGQYVDPITDEHRRAAKALKAVRAELGRRGFELLRLVLAERCFIEQAAERFGATKGNTKTAREWWGRRFRECLDEVADLFGARGPRPPRHRDEFADRSKYSGNPELDRAVRRARLLTNAPYSSQ